MNTALETAAVFAGNISCGLEGAVAHLLAWLEHELYLPGQLILHILQYPGGAKQHGRMRAVYDYKAKHGKAQEGMLAYDKEKAILGVAIDKTE